MHQQWLEMSSVVLYNKSLQLLGSTPLDLAAFRGHEGVVSALVNAGANIWVNDADSGRTPVHAAAYGGHESCLRILLDNADDDNIVNAIDSLDRSVFLCSCNEIVGYVIVM